MKLITAVIFWGINTVIISATMVLMDVAGQAKREKGARKQGVWRVSRPNLLILNKEVIPFVQMKFQTEKDFSFEFHFAFHSGYRCRRNYFGFNLIVTDSETAVLRSLESGQHSRTYFGHDFNLIADADTEKYSFRIISAMWIWTNGNILILINDGAWVPSLMV